MKKLFSSSLILALAVLCISYSANPPQGRTGAPGEATCSTPSCHSGNNVLIQGHINVLGLPDEAIPSSTYQLSVELNQTAGQLHRAGFQMTILDQEGNNAGILLNPGPSSTVSDFGQRMYFEHQPAKSFGTTNTILYEVDWISPAAPSSETLFLYLAANFTNGNGARTGDRIVTRVDTLKIQHLPDSLRIQIIRLENNCYTLESTDLAVYIQGGRAPFQVTWNDSLAVDTLRSVTPGTYEVSVTDQNGATATAVLTIEMGRVPVIALPDTVLLYLDEASMVLSDRIPQVTCRDLFVYEYSPAVLQCSDYPGIEVVVSATDSQEMSNSQVIFVQISDTIPPSMTCLSQDLRIATCAPFSYARPSASDPCMEVFPELIAGQGVNSVFPPGTTFDIYQAVDMAGNVAICSITVVNTPSIDVNIEVTDISCFGQNDGSAEITVAGPNAPYSYGLGPDLLPVNNLGPGAHEVMILDNSGCTFNRSIVVEEPGQLSIDDVEVVHPTNANSGNGKITPLITGGTPPYRFRWYTEDELFSTDDRLELLFPGTYWFDVIDNRQCSVSSDTFTVEAITSIAEYDVGKSIQILPNPVLSVAQIITDNMDDRVLNVSFFDSNGNQLKRSAGQVTVLDLNKYPAGIYFLVFRTEKRKPIVKKVVKL